MSSSVNQTLGGLDQSFLVTKAYLKNILINHTPYIYLYINKKHLSKNLVYIGKKC